MLPTAALAAAALLAIIGLADVSAAGHRQQVGRALAGARAAAGRVPIDLAAGDVSAVDGDLAALTRGASAARAGSDGAAWGLAERFGPAAGRLRSLRRGSERAGRLAQAASALRSRLTSLAPDAAGPQAGGGHAAGPDATGPFLLDGLDDLARGLNGYASAAERSGDPSAAELGRAATAAGLLADLSGGQAPRTWTVCPAAIGPCRRGTVTAGRLGPLDSTPAPRPGARPGPDLLLVGKTEESPFGPAVSPRWSPRAAFLLLYRTGSSEGARLTSSVSTEQQAIAELSGSRIAGR